MPTAAEAALVWQQQGKKTIEEMVRKWGRTKPSDWIAEIFVFKRA